MQVNTNGRYNRKYCVYRRGITMIINSIVGAPIPLPTNGEHRVRFIDPISGIVLKTQYLNTGSDATPPAMPDHPDHVFEEFNNDFTNVQRDIDVGLIYDTADGKTHAHVRMTTVSGLDLTLYLEKLDTTLTVVTMGDGTTYDLTTSGLITVPHTYASIGDYVIKIGGGEYLLGHGTDVTAFCGGGVTNQLRCLTKLYISNVRYISDFACVTNHFLSSLTIPTYTVAVRDYAFVEALSIPAVNVPSSVTYVGAYAFSYITHMMTISLPDDLPVLGADSCRDNFSLTSFILPSGVTGVPDDLMNGNYSLERFIGHDGITSVGEYAFRQCYKLRQLEFGPNLSSIDQRAFQYCQAIPHYVFHSTTPPSLGVDTFYAIESCTKIYVPDDSLAAYKAATNWTTYADYIYSISEMT